MGVPHKGPPRAVTGWDEAGELGTASLGALVLLGGILQSWDSAGDIKESPNVPGRGPPPTPLNPGAGCRSRADVSSRFWVKFPTRLERSGALERAGCRCHSWVIQEINWGLGWEAASKRTLRSDLPLAPVRSQCQKLREMLLGGARHPSHQHPQPSVTSQQTCPREGPPQPSTPRSPWKKTPKQNKNQTKSKL